MGQVTLTLNGRTYRLNCGDGEEPRLLELANYVRQRLDRLAADFGQAGDDRLMVMTALLIADELFDTRDRLDQQTTAALRVAGPAVAELAASSPLPSAPAAAPAQPDHGPPPPPDPVSQEPALRRPLRRPVARASLDERLGAAREPAALERKSETG